MRIEELKVDRLALTCARVCFQEVLQQLEKSTSKKFTLTSSRLQEQFGLIVHKKHLKYRKVLFAELLR